MPLDVASQAKSLTATLHYLERGAEKPTRYVDDPPPGVPQWNGIDDPREIRIEDARGREHEFTLDLNGFALVKAPSQVRDFYADEEVRRTYYAEVEQLLRDRLGASRVVIFDHTVRNAGRKDSREPSRRVHNDHTVNSAPRRVRDHLGADAETALRHRQCLASDPRPGSRFAAGLVRCPDLHGRRSHRQRPRLSTCPRRDLVGCLRAWTPLVLFLRHAAGRSDPHPRA